MPTSGWLRARGGPSTASPSAKARGRTGPPSGGAATMGGPRAPMSASSWSRPSRVSGRRSRRWWVASSPRRGPPPPRCRKCGSARTTLRPPTAASRVPTPRPPWSRRGIRRGRRWHTTRWTATILGCRRRCLVSTECRN
eukprot:scaffold17977_cov96-Isochrysis_galbana.AAC.5